MKCTKEKLQKLYTVLSKKQAVTILALIIMPGGIPILLWYLYKKYGYFEDLEIVIQKKNKE